MTREGHSCHVPTTCLPRDIRDIICWDYSGGIQNLLWQKPCKGAKTDSWTKFSKETVAGAHRRLKWVPHYSAQADSGQAQDTQDTRALLRLCSGMLTLGSGMLTHSSGMLTHSSGVLTLSSG